MKSYKDITICEKCKVELTNGRCLQCGTMYQDTPFEERLQEALTLEEAFASDLQTIKTTLDTFINTLRKAVDDKNIKLEATIADDSQRLHYALRLVMQRTGATFDLLTFIFYPQPENKSFPLYIANRSGSEIETNFECIEQFEDFLVGEAKYISGLITTLKLLADQ